MIDLLLVTLLQAAAGEPTMLQSQASQAQSETAAAATRAQDPRDVVRCRTRAATGTRLAKRRCSSQRQEEIARDESRRRLELIQSQRTLDGR